MIGLVNHHVVNKLSHFGISIFYLRVSDLRVRLIGLANRHVVIIML